MALATPLLGSTGGAADWVHALRMRKPRAPSERGAAGLLLLGEPAAVALVVHLGRATPKGQ